MDSPTTPGPRAVPDVETLRSLLEPRALQVHEVHGKRREEPAAAADPSTIDVSIEVTPDALSYRGRIEMNASGAVLVADIAAIFALSEEIESPSRDLMDQFSRETGLPALTPHLQAHVQSLARQLDIPVPSWPQEFS